jgi:hypothetical protein
MENNNDSNILKKISINGTHNKYHMKKILENQNIKEKKQRIETKNWNISKEYFQHDNQIKIIKDILNNNNNHCNDITKLAIQQINKKIYNYKQQDIIKKHFSEEKFLTFDYVIHKIDESELKCIYCKKEMFILYDISREMSQWTVDRIDNNIGHNNDNFHLSCLECNLKKRRTNDEKFLFTKQLNIIKHK